MKDRGRITVTANGQKVEMDPGTRVGDFLAQHRLEPRSVLVEINGAALLKSEFDTRVLIAEDRVEIIRVVAGG
ncbi:MAG: sulfur carrier protein ThiS [Verrucomicrobiae bacterium]|nr:sulfur carrier protein ThiS [Verrucomicrobiae bacterium]